MTAHEAVLSISEPRGSRRILSYTRLKALYPYHRALATVSTTCLLLPVLHVCSLCSPKPGRKRSLNGRIQLSIE